MQKDKQKVKLLMNSQQAKEIKAWFLDGMLFDFHFLRWKVSIWNSFPFVCFHKGGGRTLRAPDEWWASHKSKLSNDPTTRR